MKNVKRELREKESMKASLISALLPVLRFFQLFCIAPFYLMSRPERLHRDRILYNVYTILMLIFWLCYHVYAMHQRAVASLAMLTTDAVVYTVDFAQLFTYRVTHVAIIVESLVKQNQQKCLLEKFFEIDTIFGSKFNMKAKNLRLMRRRLILHVSAWMTVLSCCVFFIFETFLRSISVLKVVTFTLTLLTFLLSEIRYFQIIVFISLLTTRLGILNRVLKSLRRNYKNGMKASGFSRKHHPLHMIERLSLIRDTYTELWEASNLINECFGWSFLLNTAYDFINITSNAYRMFRELTDDQVHFKDVITLLVWTFPHVFCIIAFTLMCQNAVNVVRYEHVFMTTK